MHTRLFIQVAHLSLSTVLLHDFRQLQLQLVREMSVVCDLLLLLRVEVRHVDLMNLLQVLLVRGRGVQSAINADKLTPLGRSEPNRRLIER